MKKLFVFALIITTISSSFAREFGSLKEVKNTMDKLYQVLGLDNNYIESIYYDRKDLGKIISQYQNSSFTKLNKSNAFGSIKKCVFMPEGAYGKHLLDKKDQNFLASKLLRLLHNDFLVAPTIYLVENFQMEIINKDCAILLVGALNHEAIILQGVSVD